MSSTISFKGIGELPYGASNNTFTITTNREKYLGIETEDTNGAKYILMRGCVGLMSGDIVLYDRDFNTILASSGLSVASPWQGYAVYVGDDNDPADSANKAGYFLIKGRGECNVEVGTPKYSPQYMSVTPGVPTFTPGTAPNSLTGLSVQSDEVGGKSDIFIYSNVMNVGGGTSAPTGYRTTMTLVAGDNVITHNLGTNIILIQIFDAEDEMVIFKKITNTGVTATINVLSPVVLAEITIVA